MLKPTLALAAACVALAVVAWQLVCALADDGTFVAKTF